MLPESVPKAGLRIHGPEPGAVFPLTFNREFKPIENQAAGIARTVSRPKLEAAATLEDYGRR